MSHRNLTSWSLTFACIAALTSGCFQDIDPTTSGSNAEDSDDESTGDGDPTGDGDGDGDGDQTGDGDGDQTGDGDGDQTGDGDGDPTEGPVCDSGFSCVTDPGPAWSGPFALRDVDVGCGDNYPEPIESLFANLQVGASSCSCSCGAPSVQCSTSMSAIGYAQNNCVNGQGSHAITQNQCYNTFSASHAVSLANASSSCSAGSVAESLPEPSFGTTRVSCGGFELGPDACGAGALCVPDPDRDSIGGLCYSSVGDVTCPAGYPNKTLLFTGYEDTRDCPNSCSCSASGATCTVSITGFASANCVSAQGAVSTDSGSQVCAAVSNAVASIRPGNVTVKNTGTCNPGAANLTGDVTSTGAMTVCCSG